METIDFFQYFQHFSTIPSIQNIRRLSLHTRPYVCPPQACIMIKTTLMQYIKENNQSQNETWIAALTVVGDGNCLRVIFPHTFFAPWFFQNKKTLFEKAVTACFPKTYTRISYESKVLSRVSTVEPAPPTPPEKQSHTEQEKTFDNFIYNSKNAFCLGAVLKIAREPPGTLYTPVVLCGNTGTGKSHIITALAKSMLMGTKKILLLPARDLPQFFTQERSPKIFWKTHGALFIDDIHELHDKPDLQESLIHYLDACPKHRQIFLTFLGSADQLSCFEQRLTTRLGSGLLLNLLEPDIDVRLQIVQKFCAREHLTLTYQQMLLLAQNSTLCRHIQGLILKIQAYKTVHGRLNQGDIESIVDTGVLEKKLNAQDILKHVSEEMRVSVEDILGTKRQSDLVLARQMAMYICRSRLGLSYPELGKIFGGKDHSTVIHAIKKITTMLTTDSAIHVVFQAINRNL